MTNKISGILKSRNLFQTHISASQQLNFFRHHTSKRASFVIPLKKALEIKIIFPENLIEL